MKTQIKRNSSLQKVLFALIFLVTMSFYMVMGGCARSDFNCTPLEGVLGGDINLIPFSYKIAENLTAMAMPPLIPMHPGQPILVTTIVDNNDLQQTSQFGRILQEHISSRFVQLGYTVREIKLEHQLHITPKSGETMLTRDSTKLNTEVLAQAILVGTISRTDKILYVSVRLINPKNGNIISSDDHRLCLDEHMLTMFGYKPPQPGDEYIQEPARPFLNSFF